jgi:hypothetical protein
MPVKTKAKRRPARGHLATPPAERGLVLKPQADREFAAALKLKRLVKALGLNATARVLNVDRGQLSRCAGGTEAISQGLARRIIDVEYVLDRALRAMWPDEVGPWLTSPEPLLGGSTPLNVLILSGPARVVQAIDGRAAGVFA